MKPTRWLRGRYRSQSRSVRKGREYSFVCTLKVTNTGLSPTPYDAIRCSIHLWLSTIQIQCDEKIMFKPNDVMVGALMAPSGPYLINLAKGFAEDLGSAGRSSTAACRRHSRAGLFSNVEMFYVKSSLSAQSDAPKGKGVRTADSVLSIFYELDMHDYFGQILEEGGLQCPFPPWSRLIKFDQLRSTF